MQDSKTLSPPIQISERAMKRLRRIADAEDPSGSKQLRIGVKGGGCAGFSYILEMDEAHETDTCYDFDGFNVLIELSHELHLQGMELDYESGLKNRGFIFNNPNANTTCGCGQSFG